MYALPGLPRRVALAALVLSALGVGPASTPLRAQQTFTACLVPEVGVIYMIKQSGLPDACLSESHTEMTWTEQGGSSTELETHKASGDHDPRYFTRSELSDAGVVNQASNPVDWSRLKNVPADFADGTDNSGGTPSDLVCSGCVGIGDLGTGSVGSAQIVDGSVTGSDIANLTITASKIASNAIGSGQIIDGGIASSDILDGTITGSDVASGTITGANIQNLTITGSKIATSTITSAQIENQTITGNDIASSTISATHLATSSVGSDEILNGSVGADELSSSAVTLDWTREEGTAASMSNGTNVTRNVTCPSGYSVVSGGWDYSGTTPTNDHVFVHESYPVDFNTWFFRFYSGTNAIYTLTPVVTCVRLVM